ncbi:polar amino acid transport system substrate-binding protein [Rhodoligotrophos appendicifer]|uniref:transporter substrate-binding domain-containing protein n=1 Tax=Rhodoligotrophos appendicifer TaxID=987056 RepID=UPI0014784A0A|nr:transporter substrate-binding domain-containing protein [Rhodoligotrophos appendicifer]
MTRTYRVLVAALMMALGSTAPALAQEVEVERQELPSLTAPAPAAKTETPPSTPDVIEDPKPADEGRAKSDRAAATSKAAKPAAGASTTDGTPQVWRLNPAATRPDLTQREPIKLLVGNDYPPFNYLDENGVATGFNVDLGRAVCVVLRVRCTVTAMAWEDLIPALQNGTGDAVIASLRIAPAALENVDFTKPYFRNPARFVVRSDGRIDVADAETLSRKRIAVVRGSAHEAYLSAFFPNSIIRLYDTDAQALEALRTEQVDATFGDGASLMFWTLGRASQDCCRLAHGAFTEAMFFGSGAGIAVRRGDTPLRTGFEYALDQVKASGAYDSLLKKYLPATLY